ncbi:MAG: Mfa1 family fimbria major subunit [Prevotellaceae bacterium]|jgi:hypothetical protein|nr:Mfa1 family fimbria major subunit [Prevotellaceae bacterium]
MKFLFRTTLLAALAIAGLASCNTDDLPNGTDTAEGTNVTTTMTLNLKFPTAPATRADVNAVAAEGVVKTVSVFIYSASGVLQNDTTMLLAGGFDTPGTEESGQTAYTSKVTIYATTGPKKIFVGVNLPDALKTALHNEARMANLISNARTLTRTDLLGTSSDVDGILGDDEEETGFVMCSPIMADATLVVTSDATYATANTVEVDVARLAAKVTVSESSDLTTTEPLAVAAAGGSFDNLQFAIDNFNQKSYLIQGIEPAYMDPNWDLATWIAEDGKVVESSYYDDLDNIDNAKTAQDAKDNVYGYYNVNSSTEGVAAYNNAYVAENTSETLKKGTLTRVIVKAEFLPDYLWAADEDNKTAPPIGYSKSANTLDFDTNGDFYLIVDPAGTAYYTLSKTVAVGAAGTAVGCGDPANNFEAGSLAEVLGASSVIKYTDSNCYYDLWLNTDKASDEPRYQPLRNHYYQCKITDIAALGDHTEALDTPEDVATSDTNIKVDINVLYWSFVTNNYVLGAE